MPRKPKQPVDVVIHAGKIRRRPAANMPTQYGGPRQREWNAANARYEKTGVPQTPEGVARVHKKTMATPIYKDPTTWAANRLSRAVDAWNQFEQGLFGRGKKKR